jgi:hypothetical protein
LTADPTREEMEDLKRLAAEGDVDSFGDPAMSIAAAEAAADDERIIKSGKLAGKSLWQSIWILSVPVLVQQMMAALVGTTDTLLAGNLPPGTAGAARDGVGFGASFMWVAAIVLMGLGIGAQAIIARAMGSGDLREARVAGGTAVTASLFAGSLAGCGQRERAAALYTQRLQLAGDASQQVGYAGWFVSGSEGKRPRETEPAKGVQRALGAAWATAGG